MQQDIILGRILSRINFDSFFFQAVFLARFCAGVLFVILGPVLLYIDVVIFKKISGSWLRNLHKNF